MAGRWMDERDRWGRERDWRRRDDYGREADYADDGYEPRSFGEGARRAGPGRDRVFGERDTGAGYNRTTRPGGGYSGYGAGEGFRPGYDAGDWQDRDYGGVSPAMEQDEYELERGRRSPRFQSQDYTRDYTEGGRFYGDDERQPIYRDEYGTGGVEYGRVPRGYDAGRDQGYGSRGYGPGPQRHRTHPAYGRGPSEGGTGGYDYDRGYGDAGRGRSADHGDFEDRMEQAGDFLQKAGRRVANWFRGDDLTEGSGGPRAYRTDYGRERRYRPDARGARGLGPKGYKRSDERISDEAHERLTDDSWLDASNVGISVSGGEVTLSGTVESREAKHRAERLIEDISGVGHVQNNLRVDRGDVLTGSGHGFGDSAAEAQMRREDGKAAEDPAATRTTTRRT